MIKDYDKNPSGAKVAALKARIYQAYYRDVDIDAFPKAINSTIHAVPMKNGAVFKYLDLRANSFKPNAASVGETAPQLQLTIPSIIDGISRNTMQYVYDNNGEEFVLIWEDCMTRQKFIACSTCAGGLVLSVLNFGLLDDGAMGGSIQYKAGVCPDPYYFFDGNIPLGNPVQISLAATSNFPLDPNNPRYLMGDNTATKTLTDITGVTDLDVGRIIDLVGAGVNFPTKIIPSSKFILRNGLDYDCVAGTEISFEIVKVSAGYAFFEVFRS